jgi:5-dehydro-4-deoxyglucarate dehydratase
VVAGAGYGTAIAVDLARSAEAAGADGILLLPPYLAEASQEGLFAHVRAICQSTPLGVVLYSRANGRVTPETLQRLADACPNLVAFKDGIGAMEDLWAARIALEGRLAFLNGMPTAEVFAPAYRAMGVPTYSSAIYNFAPGAAMRFFHATQAGDAATVDAMMRDFFIPYGRLRSRQPGYAVSIVKAGASIAGVGAGPLRPPLSEITREEYAALEPLVAALSKYEEMPRALAG